MIPAFLFAGFFVMLLIGTPIGVALGLAGSLALTRLLGGILYRVEPTDPATLAVVSLLLLTVAATAAILPARRATRVDPMTALRSE